MSAKFKASVLIVEDDPATGEVLAEVLEDAGYAVTLASSGTEALRLLKQQAFAVVVSDICMPIVGGLDVLQAARQSDARPEVILLTGHGTLGTSLAALRERAFDYLLKPCNPDMLLQRVSEAVTLHLQKRRQAMAVQHILEAFGSSIDVLEDSATPPNGVPSPRERGDQVIRVGGLWLDPDHTTATINGQPLHLTPMEHALLRRLAEKPGKVFRYRELVYDVYGYEVTNAEAKVLLKTHVRNIRHKIGADCLVNVRSTGYQLVVPEQLTSAGG